MIGTKQSKRAWLQMILFIRVKTSFSTHSCCGDPSLSRHIYLILSPASPPPYPSPPNLLWLHSLRTWESRYHGDGWTMAPSILKKKSSTQTHTQSHTLAILVNDHLSLGRVFMWRIFLLFFLFLFFFCPVAITRPRTAVKDVIREAQIRTKGAWGRILSEFSLIS